MKILNLVLISIVLIACIAVSLTIAEEIKQDFNNSENLVSENISTKVVLDDSNLDLNESVSESKIFWKEFSSKFVFNQEKKTKSELNIARLRLIQAKIAAKNGNEQAMQKALESHDKIMDRVRNRVEKMNFQDSNLSVPAKKLVGLERAIEVHEKRIAFLNQTLVNENLTEKQKEVIERRLEHAQNVTNKLVEINEDKKDKLVTKIMAKQNLTQEQVEAIFQLKKQNRERIKEQIRENKE